MLNVCGIIQKSRFFNFSGTERVKNHKNCFFMSKNSVEFFQVMSDFCSNSLFPDHLNIHYVNKLEQKQPLVKHWTHPHLR